MLLLPIAKAFKPEPDFGTSILCRDIVKILVNLTPMGDNEPKDT